MEASMASTSVVFGSCFGTTGGSEVPDDSPGTVAFGDDDGSSCEPIWDEGGGCDEGGAGGCDGVDESAIVTDHLLVI
jgi:hypothetical protein